MLRKMSSRDGYKRERERANMYWPTDYVGPGHVNSSGQEDDSRVSQPNVQRSHYYQD